jgi:hypothetical protein
VFKNKSAPPHRVATFDFYFEDADVHPAGSIDTFKEIVGLGIVHGVITQARGPQREVVVVGVPRCQGQQCRQHVRRARR